MTLTSNKVVNKESQRERLCGVLLELRPDITTLDRKAAMKAYSTPKETLSRYLNGHGKDPDRMVELIRFFQKRILDREKVL